MAALFSINRIKKVCKWLYRLFIVIFFLYLGNTLLFLILGAIGLSSSATSGIAADTDLFGLISITIMAIPLLFIAIIVANILKDISKGKTPFSKKQVSRIRIISLLLLIGAILITLLSPGFINILVGDTLVLGQVVSLPIDGSIPVNISQMLLALVVYCLSLVFEYGILLQQQSDDIL